MRFKDFKIRCMRIFFNVYQPTYEEMIRYFTSPCSGNFPEDYLEHTERSLFILDVIKKYATKDFKIMEVGCNVGRNLNFLFNAGYHKLFGIEINKEAIKLMKSAYPNMKVEIHEGLLENMLPALEEKSFDIVFSSAVLMHVHPLFCEVVFKHIARIVSKYLIVIESEISMSPTQYPRNYTKIFRALGMKQIYKGKGYSMGEEVKVFIPKP